MTRIYICRKCRKNHSLEQFNQNRFCRDCGTYLTSSNVKSSTRYPPQLSEFKKVAVESNIADNRLLPRGYEIRKGQVEFIEEATKALEKNEVFIGSAPCGIGKSLASLLSVLPKLEKNKLLISFRTRSQLHIFLKELRALNQPPLTVSFISKQDMCPLAKNRSGSYFDFLDECRRLKENCETGTKPFCKFYWNINKRRRQAEQLALECIKKILDPQEVRDLMLRKGFCAYEALKRVLNKVQIFLGTYSYSFNPLIRKSLFQSWGVDLSEVYLIIDEAHNVPNFARDLLSDQINKKTVENAIKETENFDHEKVDDVKDYLEVLRDDVFNFIQKGLVNSKLKILNLQDLADKFHDWSGISGEEAAEIFHEYGEYVREIREELGYDRIFSFTHRVGDFFENFFQKIGEKYIHLIYKDWNDRTFLSVKSLDGREITDPVLRRAKGSIVMSGFLSPPKIYRDLILNVTENVSLKEFDSPFPSENRLILSACDVSSRFEHRTDQMLKKCADYIEVVSMANEGNIGVFFTSYSLMNTILAHLEIDRNLIVEERRTRRTEIMEKLTKSNKNALFGVMGGKFSEGMDYPNNILKCVVTVGLPYATWNVYQQALIKYFDYKFPGNGRTYAYLTPAIFRLIQACGRVHRSANDKGCIVMLDERIMQPNIKYLLPRYYQKEMNIIKNSFECKELIKNFWKKHKKI